MIQIEKFKTDNLIKNKLIRNGHSKKLINSIKTIRKDNYLGGVARKKTYVPTYYLLALLIEKSTYMCKNV